MVYSFRVPGRPEKNSSRIVRGENKNATVFQYAVDFRKTAPPRFVRGKCINTVKGHHHGIETPVSEKYEIRGIGHEEFKLRKFVTTRSHHLWRIVHADVARRYPGKIRSCPAATDA